MTASLRKEFENNLKVHAEATQSITNSTKALEKTGAEVKESLRFFEALFETFVCKPDKEKKLWPIRK